MDKKGFLMDEKNRDAALAIRLQSLLSAVQSVASGELNIFLHSFTSLANPFVHNVNERMTGVMFSAYVCAFYTSYHYLGFKYCRRVIELLFNCAVLSKNNSDIPITAIIPPYSKLKLHMAS